MNAPVLDKVKTTHCVCGGEMNYTEGTITRVVKGQQIKVHNVPFYECPVCGEQAFDIKLRLSSLVANAYKKGTTDVIYKAKN